MRLSSTLLLVLMAWSLSATAQAPIGYYEYPVGPNGTWVDEPIDIVPHPDKGFYIAIRDRDNVPGTGYGIDNVVVVRANANGTPLWTVNLDTADRKAYDGALTHDRGSIWAGNSGPGGWALGGQAQLTRLDSLGNTLWTYSDTASFVQRSQFNCVLPTSDGGFVGSGFSSVGPEQRTYMVKVDANGAELWRWYSKQSSDAEYHDAKIEVVELDDSSLVTTATRALIGTDSLEFYRFSANGNLLQSKWIDADTFSSHNKRTLLTMPDGRIIVAVNDYAYFDTIAPGIREYCYVLYELDADGYALRRVLVNPFSHGEQTYVASGEDGSLFFSILNGYTSHDSLQYPGLLKMSPNLEVQWRKDLPWLSAQWGDSSLVSEEIAVLGDRVYQVNSFWFRGVNAVLWDTSGQFDHAGIHGRVYVDENENGQFDADERVFPSASISVNGEAAVVQEDGTYGFGDPRTDTLFVVLDSIAYHTFGSPASGVWVVLPDSGQLADTIDFTLIPNPGIYDAKADLTILTGFAGFTGGAYADVYNVGTEALVNAKASLYLDTLLTLDSISVAPYTIVGNRIDWTIPFIAPGDYDRTSLTFGIGLPPTFALWVVCDSLVVSIDSIDPTPYNNRDVVCWDIGTAYDPNDKQVSWSGAPQQYTHDLQEYGYSPDSLDYLIRFQNMGSAPAVHVVVHDTLDAGWLDLSSFRLLASSHPVTIEYLPPNIAVFRHEGIFLPDTSEGWLESQGWVKFRIGLHSPLGEGDRLENRGAIYFDFNPPIVTNAASIQWSIPQDSSGTGLEAAPIQAMRLFPNPSNGSPVRFCLDRATEGLLLCRIIDASGITVYHAIVQVENGCAHLPIDDLRPCTYQVLVRDQNNTWIERMIIHP